MFVPRVFTADAIVLKRRNTGEADRVVTVFTKQYGKIRVLARGVRKISSKRAPHIEVFSRSILTIHKGNGVDTLSEVAPVETFEALRKDLKRVSASYYICELIDGLLPEGAVHEDVFGLVIDAFEALSRVHVNRVNILRARFAAALLRLLGFLASNKTFANNDIDAYVEQLLERRLKTVRLASTVAI